MPCPLFEPRTRVMEARMPAPRLPMIYEFQGICHAGETHVDPEHRFQYCNRGNAKGNCARFPPAMSLSAIRFTVTGCNNRALTVLMMEEQNHWPGACRRIDFMLDDQRLEPDITDVCRRAQIVSFCVSYLEKLTPNNTNE